MKAIPALFTGALLACAVPAFAASAVDIGISGRIVPGACYPSLSHHEVDFGDIDAKDLQRHTATEIDRQRLTTLNISCDAPTLYGVRGVDDRAASVGNHWFPSAYGLGTTAMGEKIGAHYLEMDPARSTIDGQAAYATLSDARGGHWDYSSSALTGIPNDGRLLGLTGRVGDANGPVPVAQASVGLKHYLVVAPAEGLTLHTDVLLDGRATLELIYL
jgi:type 1 fimbria pilin